MNGIYLDGPALESRGECTARTCVGFESQREELEREVVISHSREDL